MLLGPDGVPLRSKPLVERAFGFEGYRLSYNMPGNDKLFEVPTQKCAHCLCLVVLNPERKRSRGHCMKCDAYICDDAPCNVKCIHDVT